MRVSVSAPPPELAPYIRSISVVETDAEALRLLVPDTTVNLGLRYRGFARELNRGPDPLPDASLSGLRRGARHMHTSRGGGIVVVAFREAGASAFVDVPLHELFEMTLDVACLWPASSLERVRARLAQATSTAERIALVAAFLLERLGNRRPDPLVQAAVQSLRASHGNLRITFLARELGVSRDRLEKRFRASVGTTPKPYASILRIRRAVELHRPGMRLTELAHAAGFYDQAHFNHDFQAMLGQSPQRFFGSEDHC